MTQEEVIPKVLAIDDDATWLEQVPMILEGFAEVTTAVSIDDGIKLLQDEFFDVVLLDLNFKRDARTGLDTFKLIQAMDCGVDVIVISGETNPRRLIEVFNFGIKKFISKPASVEDIRVEVQQVLEERVRRQQILSFEKSDAADAPLNPLLGDSLAIRQLREQALLLIEAGVKDILIQGETGSGKEKLARYIAYKMDMSRRFLPLHCGAIAEGLVESELFGHVKGAFTGSNNKDRIGIFEAASGGFVFLDEIGEMPLSQQTKLLRVLEERVIQRVGSNEEKKANFRLIAASHVNLNRAVDDKSFREDLYYRISKQVLVIPPLRDRKEDIGTIINSFKLEKNGEKFSFSDEAIEVLKDYDWPGNIRQLKDTVERIVLLATCPIIRQADVFKAAPEFATRTTALRGLVGTYGSALISSEKKRFLVALEQVRGNRDQAAKVLGLSRATYYRRAKELGIGRVN